jgi:hypothetical protein
MNSEIPVYNIFIQTSDFVQNLAKILTVSLGPDALASSMEIADSTSTIRTIASHGLDARIADMEIAC